MLNTDPVKYDSEGGTVIIKFSDTKTDTQGERPLVLKRIINQNHTDSVSLTWVTLFGRHEKVVNEISDRVYYIIDGEADFELDYVIDDGMIFHEQGSVTGGDVVLIPKGIPYVFEGHMTYVVLNSPGYVPDSDRVVPGGFSPLAR